MKKILIVMLFTITSLFWGCQDSDQSLYNKKRQIMANVKGKSYRDFDMFAFKPKQELNDNEEYPFIVPVYESSGKMDSLNAYFDKNTKFLSKVYYLNGIPYIVSTDYNVTFRTFFAPPYVYTIEYVNDYDNGQEKPCTYAVNISRMARITKDSIVRYTKTFHKNALILSNESEASQSLYLRKEKHTKSWEYMVSRGNNYFSKSSDLNFLFCYERGSLEFFWCYHFEGSLADCKGHDNHHGDF